MKMTRAAVSIIVVFSITLSSGRCRDGKEPAGVEADETSGNGAATGAGAGKMEAVPVSEVEADETSGNGAATGAGAGKMKAVPVSEKEALGIAYKDAAAAYGDLSLYSVEATFDGKNWHVDYYLKCRECVGGGPHYVISGTSGAILNKRYEQ